MKIDGFNFKAVLPNIPEKNLKIGDIFIAQIIEITDETLLLHLEKGEFIQAHYKSTINDNVGDFARFILKDIKNSHIYVEVEPSCNSAYDNKSTINNSVATCFNDFNKPLYKILIENEIPITEKNIKIIEDTKKHYGKLGFLFEDLVNNLEVFSDKDNSAAIKEKDYYSFKGFSEKKISDLIKELLIHSSEFELSGSETNFHNYGKISNLCKNISLDELVFMIKNDLIFNLRNLQDLHNVFLGEETITDNIIEIISELSQEKLISKEDINSLISKFKLESTEFKPGKSLNSFMNELDIIVENLKSQEASTRFENKTNNIRASIDFISKLNENFSFLQIPIYINKQLHNFELMIKRETNKKEVDIKNTKLLISIDTKKLDLVRALINIKNSNLDIVFKIKSLEVKCIIVNHENNLINSLQRMGYNVSIKYNVFENKQDNINNFKLLKTPKYNGIDLRV